MLTVCAAIALVEGQPMQARTIRGRFTTALDQLLTDIEAALDRTMQPAADCLFGGVPADVQVTA
jgi:hypothetical protein